MSSNKRPNVLWIFGDQHRGQALGIAGDPNVSTPNIDNLAREGLFFRNAYSNNPWCTPFRGSLLTGRYSHQCVWQTPQRMEPSYKTVADILNGEGYSTHYIGKWHLGGSNEDHYIPPEERGRFDSWIGYENINNQYHCTVHGHDEMGDEIKPLNLQRYETDGLTDLLIDRLRRERKKIDGGYAKPFFAVLSVQPPHNPYVAPSCFTGRHNPSSIRLRPNVPPIERIEHEARVDLSGYYGQIENLDENVGRIRAALTELQLADDTIIVFFSDHGDMHCSHGMREKSSPWEESIRIPFIISGEVPFFEHRSGFVDAPISGIDILPTTLGLCGVQVPEDIQGYDYSYYWRKDDTITTEEEPDTVYLQHLVRKMHPGSIDREWRGIVTRDGWKYACMPGAPLCMYNLNEDPYELHNMIFQRRYLEQRTHLHQLLQDCINNTGDEFILPEL